MSAEQQVSKLRQLAQQNGLALRDDVDVQFSPTIGAQIISLLGFRPTSYFTLSGLTVGELHSVQILQKEDRAAGFFDFVYDSVFNEFDVSPIRFDYLNGAWHSTWLESVTLSGIGLSERRRNGQRSLREALK